MTSASSWGHRGAVICDSSTQRGRSEVSPACKHPGKFIYCRLRIRRQWRSGGVSLRSAIWIEHTGPYRKQLQHLARKIFIGVSSCAQPHVEILAHCERQRDLTQKRSIATEGVAIKCLQVGRHSEWTIEFTVLGRGHENLV